jgi:hypothetical protein
MTILQFPKRFRPVHLPSEVPTHAQWSHGKARTQLRNVILIGCGLLAAFLLWAV